MITGKQRNAASLYWTQILTGEVNPRALIESKRGLPPFMAAMEVMHRQGYLQGLEETNPIWPLQFMNTLDSLLNELDEYSSLRLDYHPQGPLKEAAAKCGIPEGLFPTGKLTMRFDNSNNIMALSNFVLEIKRTLHSLLDPRIIAGRMTQL